VYIKVWFWQELAPLCAAPTPTPVWRLTGRSHQWVIDLSIWPFSLRNP